MLPNVKELGAAVFVLFDVFPKLKLLLFAGAALVVLAKLNCEGEALGAPKEPKVDGALEFGVPKPVEGAPNEPKVVVPVELFPKADGVGVDV